MILSSLQDFAHTPDVIGYSRCHRGRHAKRFVNAPEVIPAVPECAERADVLGPRQKITALKAEALFRGFAHVGIIALIDEATGFQEMRDRKALEAILDAFLRKEFAA
jgi:hypothetical protein